MASSNPNLPRKLDDILNQIGENPEALSNLEGLIDKEVSSLSMPEDVGDILVRVDDSLAANDEKLPICEGNLMDS